MTAERLLIWRHGRTEWNASRRIQGQSDVALDEVGLRQARQAAQLLAAEKPDAIVSSDLARTRLTAATLGHLLEQPVYEDPRLRERHFGPWQGLTADEVRREYPDAYARWRSGQQPSVPGIESDEELEVRVLEGIGAIVASTDGTACVVTHGGTARRAVLSLLAWPAEVAWRLEPLGNCRWAELRHTERGWRLHAYNAGPLSGDAGPHIPAAAADVEPPSAELLRPV